MRHLFGLLIATIALAHPAFAERTPAPEGASVYIVSPSQGETVSSPVKVIFGLTGMGVAPAGIEKENTGHHHLLIDQTVADLDLSAAVPADDQHLHFGGGQTETVIQLDPGTHTLQLLLADWSHIPFDPPIASEVVTITVE